MILETKASRDCLRLIASQLHGGDQQRRVPREHTETVVRSIGCFYPDFVQNLLLGLMCSFSRFIGGRCAAVLPSSNTPREFMVSFQLFRVKTDSRTALC